MTFSHLATFAALILALPAAAETTQIGTIEATFGDQAIRQTTLRVEAGDDTMATAEFDEGPGYVNLSIYGGDVGRQLSLSLMYMGSAPTPAAQPVEASVAWFPNGMGDHWSSDDAPQPATFAFSRLDMGGDAGHATGTFTATLCAVPAPAAPDCRPISGSFDTRLFRMAD